MPLKELIVMEKHCAVCGDTLMDNDNGLCDGCHKQSEKLKRWSEVYCQPANKKTAVSLCGLSHKEAAKMEKYLNAA